MSNTDDPEQHYHLTQDGWIDGQARPRDAIESWMRRMYQQIAEQPELVWVDSGVSMFERDRLHKKFPRPFSE